MINNTLPRPAFPKRAVITGGMPYGEKELHFGHVGGYFIHADIFARFLRDRVGADNVLFVSGTDCFGAGAVIGYEKAVAEGFDGKLEDFIRRNHLTQKKTLEDYLISLDLYGASALDEAGRVHAALSAEIFHRLYDNNALSLESTTQFFDKDKGVFLNGRQVQGRCPIQGCKSEHAYADECSIGHQYDPSELIAPVSALTGAPPERVQVKNWFFDLPAYHDRIAGILKDWALDPSYRKTLLMVIDEFMKKPSIYVKSELVAGIRDFEDMPGFVVADEDQKSSWELVFEDLRDRAKAVAILSREGIRYRTGKTLVPFRLSGNVPWGVPVPDADGLKGLTFWVWPESLWAPISFTKTRLGDGVDGKEWEKWWKSEDARVYQFIGEDNIYFYGIAEMGIFMGLDEGYQLPVVVPNRHILYGKTKASSSGEIKPPMAAELLDYYTPEQLRLHFMHASLKERNVGFEPKAFLEKGGAGSDGFDTALYEGNLVTNIFNRLVRSCFYTAQKYFAGILPDAPASAEVIAKANETILEYERLMAETSFDKVFELLNVYMRDANKDWSARSKSEDIGEIGSLLADSFHAVKTAAILLHPVTPVGCEMIREYLGVDERLWSWDYIFEPLSFFTGAGHRLRELEPRVDFFKKHPSQLA